MKGRHTGLYSVIVKDGEPKEWTVISFKLLVLTPTTLLTYFGRIPFYGGSCPGPHPAREYLIKGRVEEV